MLDRYIEKKLEFRLIVAFGSAVLCGLAMGFVTTFAMVLSAASDNAVLGKFVFGAAFSALLLLVVLNGYELFTGNTMLLTVAHKKESRKRVLQNLFFVYFGNLIGCVLAAVMILLAGVHESFSLADYLKNVFAFKTEMNVGKMFLLGILANYFVCMGVYLSFRAGSVTEKYLSLFFPICIFCVLGFEHSIANMFTLFYALFVGGGNILLLTLNLLVVTLGNTLGGVLFALSTKLKKQ